MGEFPISSRMAPGSLPLVGRARERLALAGALAGAATGHGLVLLIEGEAGIGKTRLVEETIGMAVAHGFSVCAGAVDEVEQRRPFGVLADALGLTGSPADPDRASVARLLHDGGTRPPAGRFDHAAGLEFRVGEAIADLVERLSARDPLLLVLEDLHWTDPATLTCLARMSRSAVHLPLLLVVTARPLPRTPELTAALDAVADRGTVRLPLAPLGDPDLPVLAEAVIGAPPGPNLRGQLRRAGGNPLLLIELLGALDQDGAIVRTGRTCAETDGSTAAPVPTLTILHRLSFLPRATLDVLSSASILGSSFSVTDLRLLTGRPAAELAGPLRTALDAQVLVERGDRLGFRHELVRDALYSDLPSALREALHRDLARALAAAGQPAGRVVEHLLRGASPGDAEAVRWLRRAAEEVLARSPSVSVELLDHATALADPTTPDRGALDADRAVALMFAGRGEEGEAVAREVLARRADPDRESALRWLLLRTMLIRGRAAEALKLIESAGDLPGASMAEQAHFRAAESFARLVTGRVDAAVDLAEQAVELAGPTGDALAVSESLHAKAQVQAFRGAFVEAAELACRAVRVLAADDRPRGPQTATATAGMMLVSADRVDEGLAMLQQGRRLNEGLGARSGLALHHVVLANALFLTGSWDDAASEIVASVQLTGDGRPAWPVMSLGILAVIAVHRDEPATAQAHVAAARAALAAGAGPMRAHRMLLAGVLLSEAAGRPAEALATLVAGWDRIAGTGAGAALPEIGPELVRRLVPAGETGRAADVTAAVQACAAANPGVPSISGAALLCRGLIDSDPEALVGAVAEYRRGAQPLARALACEDASRTLRWDGDREQAVALLREARAGYAELAAQRSIARVTAALRALGVRGGSQAPRARATSGWEALTATERTVAGLVAQRLSNPEIAERMYLSRRTVETHVSHALAKLGVRSRLELGAMVSVRE
ncbi:LuxR family transcriptional regulator [Pseudonocardia sp.]|uniref:ATP-binding protein n=1 Tax=Pseudonocardia sp. TaxID=60912 RepID=UPI0026199793|nr:LuxR family transcriptional regulator [Pseudonocardia sp.]